MVVACHHHQNIIGVAWIDWHDLLVARLSQSRYRIGRLISDIDNHGGKTQRVIGVNTCSFKHSLDVPFLSSEPNIIFQPNSFSILMHWFVESSAEGLKEEVTLCQFVVIVEVHHGPIG